MLIKDAASIQKLFFEPLHHGAYHQYSLSFNTHGCTKINKTHIFWTISKDEVTIQERPVMAQVR